LAPATSTACIHHHKPNEVEEDEAVQTAKLTKEKEMKIKLTSV